MSTDTHRQIANDIWSICNLLRGPYKRNEYRKVILPLTVLRRFDGLLAPTKAEALETFNQYKGKPESIIRSVMQGATGYPFYNLSKLEFRTSQKGVNSLLDDPSHLAPNLNSYINGFSPNVRAIMERFAFDQQIARMAEKNLLFKVVQKFATFDLSFAHLAPDQAAMQMANATSANTGRLASAKLAKAQKTQVTELGAVKPGTTGDRCFAEWLPLLPPHLGELVALLDGHVLSLGDDVQRKELKLYVAFKRLKNFATLVPQKNRLLLYLHIDPAQVVPLPANGCDVSQQGHWGTGDLELALTSQADLDAAKPLILMAYEGRAAFAASKATPTYGS